MLVVERVYGSAAGDISPTFLTSWISEEGEKGEMSRTQLHWVSALFASSLI